MVAALAFDVAVAPADRLVTMPPFPLDGSVRTLGVQVVTWCHQNLTQPNGPRAGQPFRFTPGQINFILWAYAVDPQGRWLFNVLVRRLAKGSGKSPFGAALALCELLGPVRFAGWCEPDPSDPSTFGGVLGKPVDMPLVQIFGVAASQTMNTMRFVRAFCPKGGTLARKYDLDPGKTQIFLPPEGTLEVITASFTAAEGAQTTFAIGDEPEHMHGTNGGVDMVNTVADNLTKTGGRMLQTCNAWQPGIGSVAEATWDDWAIQEEGSNPDAPQRILYDARVAPPGCHEDRDSLTEALSFVYEDCPWVDVSTIAARFFRRSSKPADNIRKYLNRPTIDNSAWIVPDDWAAMFEAKPIGPKDEIVLFFDGSKSRDATALIGCRVSDGHVFTIGVWEPDLFDDEATVDVGAVDAAVAWSFANLNPVAFFADVREWESFALTSWPQLYGDRLVVHSAPSARPPQSVAWDMRGHAYEFAKAVEACRSEIQGREFTHGPLSSDERHVTAHNITARHLANCRTREYRDLVTVRKDTASKRIDAAVCVVGARMVRRLALGTTKKKRSGQVWGF